MESKSVTRGSITCDMVVALRKEGLAVMEIADRLGCSRDTVTKRLRDAGMPPTENRSQTIREKNQKAYDLIWPEIKSRLDSGDKPTGLSREYHIEYLNFLKMMRDRGYPWNYDGLDEKLEKKIKPKKPRKGGMGKDEFVARARGRHGDFYDYSQTEYVNTKTKVKIICPYHGVFEQTPEKHMAGNGCPHPECIKRRTEATNQERYGAAHPLQSKEIMEKMQQKNIEKYGVANPMQTKEVQDKLRDTCMERYGVSSPLASSEVREKIVATNEVRYGGVSPLCSSEIQEKSRQTIQKRYGVDNVMQDAGIKAQMQDTLFRNHGVRNAMLDIEIQQKQRETQKQVMTERYGADSGFGSTELREKARMTNLKRYGAENVMHVPEFVQKMFDTKVENGTTSTSSAEERLYELLCQMFSKDDVDRQYKSACYPWHCDFHIKSRNLFIELNAHWSHNLHWFDVNDNTDMAVLSDWKSRESAFYNRAVKVWSEYDVQKRQKAKDENLNYIVFWDDNLRDAALWFAMGCPDGKDWDHEYSWLPQRSLSGASVFGRQDLTGTPTNLSAIAKQIQFREFYHREITMWEENPVIRGLPLQVFLYHNRLKYINKLPQQLTDMELARGFTISGILKGYTVFHSDMMDAVMQKYQIQSVYDPCAGWGERALYCKSHGDIPYLGVDVNINLFPGYDVMSARYGLYDKQKFYHGSSANINLSGQYDAVVTCPPYGDTEIYSEFGAENYDCNMFLDWWDEVVENSKKVSPRLFCFQVNRAWRNRMLAVVEKQGFVLEDEVFPVKKSSSHFTRGKDGVDYKKEFETMLVCRRV